MFQQWIYSAVQELVVRFQVLCNLTIDDGPRRNFLSEFQEIQSEPEPPKQPFRIGRIPEKDMGTIVYELGPKETFALCKDYKLKCSQTGLIYKYIKSAQFLKFDRNWFSFEHALKCKWIQENDANPKGFKTKLECVSTMLQLRKWTGFNEFTTDQVAELKGVSFNDALKCRWNRALANIPKDQVAAWTITLNNCLENMNNQRLANGFEPCHP